MEKDFNELVKEEAYRIWEWRKSTWIFDYGRIGDDKDDWYQAEKIIESRQKAEACGISPHSRIEKYF